MAFDIHDQTQGMAIFDSLISALQYSVLSAITKPTSWTSFGHRYFSELERLLARASIPMSVGVLKIGPETMEPAARRAA